MSTSTQRWTLAATVLGSSMAIIDGTVVNVALPVLQTSLHAGVNDAQWIVDAYLLVLSSLILAGGSLGDHLGRTRVYGAGVALFAAASLWCGLAPTAPQLIVARAVQGVGAALLMPGSLALIADVYDEATRGRAIGTWSALTTLGVLAGPLLGGVLIQTLSWRAAFFVNLPIAAAVLVILALRVPRSGREERTAIDWTGTLLVTGGLGGVVFALIEGPVRGWKTPLIAISGVAGIVALVAFGFVERHVANPIVPLSLFRSRAFSGANFLTLLLYAAMSAATFLLPFNLIQVQHYTPFEAGAAFLPFVFTMTLISRFSGALADRIGARVPLMVGPLVAACGFVLLAMRGDHPSYWSAFFPGVLTLGIGMAITVAPLTTTVMTSIDEPRHAGAASGINNAIARAAGLLAIALFGAIAVMVFSRSMERALADAPAPLRAAMQAQATRLADAAPPRDATPAMRAKAVDAVRSAFLDSFRVNLYFAAGLAAASALGATIIKPTRRQSGP